MIFDVVTFQWLNGLAGHFEPFDQVIRLLAGDHLLPVLSVISLIWLWLAGTDRDERTRFQRGALDGLLALGLASLMASLLAPLIGRVRPFLDLQDVHMLFYAPTDHSFPSHAVAVLVAVGTAVRSAHKQIGNAVIAAGVAMGFARIVAGVHWPSDVLGGIALGVTAGLLAHWLLNKLGPVRVWLTRALLGTFAEVPSPNDERGQRVLRH